MTAADEWSAENGGNPMFNRMTDGEIAHYLEDRDREPSEPDFDAIEDERHSREVHGGGPCDCPVPTEEEIAAQWAEEDRKHNAEYHGGGACDCSAPF